MPSGTGLSVTWPSQIPRAERARRHEAAAGWIEARAAGRVEDMAELLAHHALAALELARGAGDASATERLADAARRYLRMAGERAMGLDVSRAAALLSKALALAPADDPDHLDVALAWVDAANQSARYKEAEQTIDSLMPSLRAGGES